MEISYGIDTEYMTSPKKDGNYWSLSKKRREELELVPYDKTVNGPWLLYIQFTAPDFTTAIFYLRKICKMVGVGDNRHSQLPDEL